ncbi:MAG TPA: potassium channel family protein [Candidatus Binataceae bacterium]
MRPRKFEVLLGLILILFVVHPFFFNIGPERVTFSLLLASVLICALYSAFERRRNAAVAIAFALLVFVGRALPAFATSATVYVTVESALMLLMAIAAGAIIVQVLNADEVTRDTICAAICAYFMMGLAWGVIYSILDFVRPGSLHSEAFVVKLRAPGAIAHFVLLDYVEFSFVTLTSLGYGDVVPVFPGIRAVALVEAAAGQFYIAVLIARLVSIQTARHLERRRDSARVKR